MKNIRMSPRKREQIAEASDVVDALRARIIEIEAAIKKVYDGGDLRPLRDPVEASEFRSDDDRTVW